MESLDEFLDQKVTASVIIRYYLYFFPEIIKLLTPVAMLMASLFAIGRLSNQNEVTAMKSGGMSLYRILTPLLLLSVLISFGQLYFNGWIVPRALVKKYDIERQYLGKGKGGTQMQAYNLYFRDNPSRNVIFGFYDGSLKSGNDITIEEYSSELQPRVVRRIDARRIAWDSLRAVWTLNDGFIRTTQTDGNIQVHRLNADTISLTINNKSILELQRAPEEMNLDELHEYIRLLEQGGKDVRMKLIDYYGQYAFPFANFIVVLFGVPFASVRKKSGIAVEIGTAMVVSFVYLVFTKVSQSLGFELSLDPIIIGWSANALFFLIGLLNLARTKT